MDKDKGVLAIDLDGTLAKREQPFNPYSVGEPVEKLLKAALAEKAKGRKIVCFTARAASKDKKMHATVRAWLDKHGLEGVEITNEKDRHITEIWDDRARGVVPDKGVFTDGKKASTPPDNPAQEVKAAKTMVRKERVEIQHDDHCPHCDHKFSEKGYPRPDFSKLPEDEDERQRMIMNGDYDEICPRCNGIVDPIEMTDEEIDSYQESAWLSKDDLRKRRDKRRARIAARENVKEAKLRPDKLQRLRLRRGCCPECGHDNPMDAPYKCDKCGRSVSVEEMKSAAGGFQRPENYDCISKLEKADVEIWVGANDWEDATTWMWAVHRPKGPDVNNESLVWVELKYPDLPHPGDTGVSSEDLAKIKQLAKRLPKEWEAEAKKIESPPTLEAFEKALQSAKLKPFVAASGLKDSRDGMRKWASAVPSSPPDTDVRGPRRLLQMLQNLDLAKLEAQAIADAKSGKITKRDKAVKILSAIEGLKRTNIKPEELMITRVPVLPPQFRPFSTMGTTFIPGSANELYQDLFRHRQAHKETLRELGEDMAGNTRLNLLNAVRALYGYGDPVSPKLQGRETKGYLKQVLGSGGPKFSFVQRKLLSRPIDSVGRGVITVDPDLDMNQISIPEELAWETYGSHVQRRLVQSLGMKPVEALKMVKDRTKEAQLALKQEMSPETGRPVIYSRAPAWHKFNTIAGWPKLHTGHNIAISPFVSAGLNADYDGDTINVSVPILPESVEEAKKKLMPDKMLFAIRDQDSVMAQPKHEMVLGLYTSATRPSGRVFQFDSKQKAIAAVENGDVNYDDDIEFPGD